MAPVLPIRFESLAPTPWANGLGTTVELYRHPFYGPFDLRLSLATIASPAPFSPLPGVDRALMALGDDGLTLEINGRRVDLERWQSVSFAGEDQVSAVDVSATSYDLNLMVRRGWGAPRFELVTVDGRIETAADTTAVVALTGGLTARGARLGFGDVVVGSGIAVRGLGAVAVATRQQ